MAKRNLNKAVERGRGIVNNRVDLTIDEVLTMVNEYDNEVANTDHKNALINVIARAFYIGVATGNKLNEVN